MCRVFGLFLMAAWLTPVVACGDDETVPQSVPFEGIDPSKTKRRRAAPKPKSSPDPKPDDSSPTSKSAPKPDPRPGDTLATCCASLELQGRTSPAEQDRHNAKVAAKRCNEALTEVRKGRMEESAAMTQVKAAIVGYAPGNCQ